MAQTNYIEALIEEGGEITLGALPPHECVATAADGSNCLAMLVRLDGESFNALLKRLDKAIGVARSNDMFIDEVNGGESDLLSSPRGSNVKRALRPRLQGPAQLPRYVPPLTCSTCPVMKRASSPARKRTD